MRLHRDSTEFVHVTVSADVDLGDQAVALAFPLRGTQPEDWYPAVWVGSTSMVNGKYTRDCRVLVGPEAGVLGPALDVGTYTVYAHLTDNPEVPVLVSGTLSVF